MNTYPDDNLFSKLVLALRGRGYHIEVCDEEHYRFGKSTDIPHILIGFCTSNYLTYKSLNGSISVILNPDRCGWDNGKIILPLPVSRYQTKFIINQVELLREKRLDYSNISKYDYGLI